MFIKYVCLTANCRRLSDTIQYKVYVNMPMNKIDQVLIIHKLFGTARQGA